MTKVYYGPYSSQINSEFQILPAPQISITQNMNYNNDVIIGYSYTIDINGIASTFQQQYHQTLTNNEVFDICTGDNLQSENNNIFIGENESIINTPITGSGEYVTNNMYNLIQRIDFLRSLFAGNGNSLLITDDQNNILLKANGGILKSLTFDEGNNQWSVTCPYSVSIEFNELNLLGEDFSCGTSYISSHSSGIVDTKIHKIQSFTDGWSFNLEDDSLNYVVHSGDTVIGSVYYSPPTPLFIYNTVINVSYNISVTGKNYFSEENLIPGWINAKNFAQSRFHYQINNLKNALEISGSGAASATLSLSSLGKELPSSSDPSSLNKDLMSKFGLYNETLSCDTSESDGTFNLTYNAILKKKENTNFSSSDAIHRFTKEYSVSKEGQKSAIAISINGTIEGLCTGGIVSTTGLFNLPKKGTFLVKGDNNNKYNNAKILLDKIIEDNDLVDDFKRGLEITFENMAVSGGLLYVTGTGNVVLDKIKPATFNLTKNFMEGTITYSVEYNSDKAATLPGNQAITNISIETNKGLPVLAEFAIPGSGFYIVQDIGTRTSPTINITVDGRTPKNCCFPNALYEDVVTYYRDNSISGILNWIKFPIESGGDKIITQKTFSHDPMNGTFNLNLSYICRTGCVI